VLSLSICPSFESQTCKTSLGGQQQRVALATVVGSESPEVLLSGRAVLGARNMFKHDSMAARRARDCQEVGVDPDPRDPMNVSEAVLNGKTVPCFSIKRRDHPQTTPVSISADTEREPCSSSFQQAKLEPSQRKFTRTMQLHEPPQRKTKTWG